MWWKKKTPERVVISLEEEARLNWESAQAELLRARGKLDDFIRENFRDDQGTLVYISSGFNRQQLDAELHACIVAHDEALKKLHDANAALSNFKKDGVRVTNTEFPPCPECGSVCITAMQGRLRCQQCSHMFDRPKVFHPQVVRKSGEPPPDARPACPTCQTPELVVRLANGWRCNADGTQF